ncbi:MAG: hypothetical protein ACOH2N_13415 [Devosia sp.]
MDFEAFGLPWATLMTLASGYAGYYVANVGLREHHKTIDITFSTLVFGFFATIVYMLIGLGGSFHPNAAVMAAILSPLGAFGTSIGLGVWWSKIGRKWLEEKLRDGNVSHSNELPSAWASMQRITDTTARQLHVKLTDGTWLKCEDMRAFSGPPIGEAPNGPCVFGGTGDILMYVTHRKIPDGKWKPVVGTLDTEWGYEITYIPAAQVALMDYRRRPASWPPLDAA